MSQSNRTFRVFVSSTFSDLKEERNALQKFVFPRLRELAQKYNCRFQAIDLRWGISEEAALDQQTMKICLNEIERCQQVSPRPNFIILLGDRFGWRPLPYVIPADEFKQILPLSSPEHQEMLLWKEEQPKGKKGWYRLDVNAVPVVYVLQPRERGTRFEEYSIWEQEIERPLVEALERAALQAGLKEDALVKYTFSATGQEIVNGALMVKDADEHVFAFLRSITNPNEETCADRSTYYEDNPDLRQRQQALKEQLRKSLPGNITDFQAHWCESGLSNSHIGALPEQLEDCLKITGTPQTLCETVWQRLSHLILLEVAKLDIVDPLEREQKAHAVFASERTRFFTGREELLLKIGDYLSSSDTSPLAVWGESGSGKSALMAKAFLMAQQRREETVIFISRFIGTTPKSSNGWALLESLCRQITRAYQEDETTIPTEYRDLALELPKRLALASADKPLVLFLDALDQLPKSDPARNLSWLPANLPPYVKLVISTLPGEEFNLLQHKLPGDFLLKVTGMDASDGEMLLSRWLGESKRSLTNVQREEILMKFLGCGGLPLYLKLAVGEVCLWHSYDDLPALSNQESGLGTDIQGLIQDLFWRLEQESQHGKVFISRAIGYLAASKNGLSEDEMLDLLWLDQDVQADFLRRSPKSPKALSSIPIILWSRVYLDLAPYLTWRQADETELLGFYHRQIGEAAAARYFAGEKKISRHRHLADYFGNPKRPFWIDQTQGLPDRRKASEIVYQQAESRLKAELKDTLTRFDFMQARIIASGSEELIEDYDQVRNASIGLEETEINGLQLIQDGLRLSQHVLQDARDQLAGQIWGRLSSFSETEVRQLLSNAKKAIEKPWLRPLAPCFTTPGGSERFTLKRFPWIVCSPDGQKAVLASEDETLRVWDLQLWQERLTIDGHKDRVEAVAFTPDSRLVISASSDRTLKGWNLETGQECFTLAGHLDRIYDVAITQDGRLAVSASDDQTLKVWDIPSGQERFTLSGHTGYVRAVAISPDDQLAVSGSWDSTLKVWDLQTGQERFTLTGHEDRVDEIVITSDGQRVISSSNDGSIKVWDLQTGQECFTLEGCTSVTITPDEKRAISIQDDYSSLVWDILTGQECFTLTGHTEKVMAVAITPDGRFAVSGSFDNTLKVWDMHSGQELCTLIGHTGWVYAIVITPDSRYAISASSDQTLKVWDLHCLREGISLARHTDRIRKISVDPYARFALSASLDETLKVWDLQNCQEQLTLTGHHDKVWAAEVAPDGRLAASTSENQLKVWDLQTGQARLTLPGKGPIALTPDGQWCISGSDHYRLKVRELRTGKERFTLAGHENSIIAMAVTPDGKQVLSVSRDHTLKLWNLENGKERYTLTGHSLYAAALAISPDGQLAVTASNTGSPFSLLEHSLQVWDLQTGNELFSLEGTHKDVVNAIAITPDGRLVVSASSDNTLKIWDLQTRKEKFILAGHNGSVKTLALARDGKLALSAAWNIIKVWDITQGTCITTFNAMSEVTCAAATPDGCTWVVGDDLGQIYFLRLENILAGPPVVCAWKEKSPRWSFWQRIPFHFGCPICRVWSSVPESSLGTIQACPQCGNVIQLNSFTIEGDWHVIADAWKAI